MNQMKQVKFIILALSLAVAAVFVTAKSLAAEKREKAENAEQVIKQLEDDWLAALVKGDYDTYDRIVASDWMITGPEGDIQTKAEFMADWKAGVFKAESMKNDELKVRIYGDTAVVFGLETEKSTYKGKDTSGQYRFTDVLVKRGGRWQAVSTHLSRVAKK
jgi:ketosteroid isomerase-like protein